MVGFSYVPAKNLIDIGYYARSSCAETTGAAFGEVLHFLRHLTIGLTKFSYLRRSYSVASRSSCQWEAYFRRHCKSYLPQCFLWGRFQCILLCLSGWKVLSAIYRFLIAGRLGYEQLDEGPLQDFYEVEAQVYGQCLTQGVDQFSEDSRQFARRW